MSRRRLGQLEAEVLAALAAADGPLSPARLRDRIPGDPAYTTVNTILFRLHTKQLVTRERHGRHYLYRLAVDESRLVADRMRDHLRHASDPSGVLNRFVQNLTAEEEHALRTVLDAPRTGTFTSDRPHPHPGDTDPGDTDPGDTACSG